MSHLQRGGRVRPQLRLHGVPDAQESASNAGYGVFTDHSIPRVPGPRPATSWNLRGRAAADTVVAN